jgi:hypothetical protein
MSTKTINTLFLLTLVIVSLFSYLYIPHSFELEGGSCYQGITSSIIRFLLTVCGLLSIVSLIINYFSKYKTSKTLSILSLLIWLIWSLFFLTNTFIYFISFLLVSIGICWWSFKFEKREKQSKHSK